MNIFVQRARIFGNVGRVDADFASHEMGPPIPCRSDPSRTSSDIFEADVWILTDEDRPGRL